MLTLRFSSQGIKRLTGYRTKCGIDFIEKGLHPNLQEVVNQQINTELTSSYAYLTIQSYFKRLTVNLNGFAQMAGKSALEEQEHAKKLIELVNHRGGVVIFSDVKVMKTQNWETPLDAMKDALKLENATASGLVNVIETARSVGDLHVEHFVHGEMLDEQMGCIYDVKKWISILEACKSPECLLMIDKKLEKM